VYDDMAVYPKTLTPREIQKHFSAGFSGQACDLSAASTPAVSRLRGAVGVWRLDSGPVAWDSVGCRNGGFGDSIDYTTVGPLSDGNKAITTHDGPMRAYVGDAVTPGGPVTLEYWAKPVNGVGHGVVARLGTIGLYRYDIVVTTIRLQRCRLE
jgi:hypothetical protein